MIQRVNRVYLKISKNNIKYELLFVSLYNWILKVPWKISFFFINVGKAGTNFMIHAGIACCDVCGGNIKKFNELLMYQSKLFFHNFFFE